MRQRPRESVWKPSPFYRVQALLRQLGADYTGFHEYLVIQNDGFHCPHQFNRCHSAQVGHGIARVGLVEGREQRSVHDGLRDLGLRHRP